MPHIDTKYLVKSRSSFSDLAVVYCEENLLDTSDMFHCLCMFQVFFLLLRILRCCSQKIESSFEAGHTMYSESVSSHDLHAVKIRMDMYSISVRKRNDKS